MMKTVKNKVVLKQMKEMSFEAGKILISHLRSSYKKPIKILDKGPQGLATEADILSEKYVIKKIKSLYPDHLILSEEDAFVKNIKDMGPVEDQYMWLIDPLDGTNNFYNRLPFFCVSLALVKGNTPLVGVVYNPVTEECFYAIKGQGAFYERVLGGKKLKTKLKASSQKKEFIESLLSANLTSKRVEKDLLKRFPQVRAMRRLGSAALELSYVAAGILDGYWEYRLQPWDIAAAGLICQEAGVKISTIEGKEFSPFCGSVLAARASLYLELKRILLK